MENSHMKRYRLVIKSMESVHKYITVVDFTREYSSELTEQLIA